MKKRILFLALVMAMIFTLLLMSAFAADVVAEGTCGGNLTWILDSEGTLTINGTGAMTDYSYNSKAPWFNSRSSIKSVTIGNSVTSIGNYAFYDCDGLTSVTIGNSVTSIGNYAFYDCDGLTKVTIGNSVTSIGGSAFSGCDGMTSVTIPNSVTSIGGSAFSGCDGLTSVTIPDSVTSIGDSAFYYCTGLTEINYNAKAVTDLTSSSKVFYEAGTAGSGIKVTFGDGVEKIPAYLFKDCRYLTSVTIGNSVTSIGNYAFDNCDGLTSVTIGNSVTSIGGCAFYDCDGLTSVTIPDSVTSIGYSAFYDCYGLTSVTIGNSVTSIGNAAFYDCHGLTSVTIGNSVTSIGDNAFYNCTELTEINYNAKAVTDLTSSSTVFDNAGKAGSGIKVTFGEKVKKVPDYLFSTSSSLCFPKIREIVFVGNAPTIGSKSFSGVTTSAYYPYGNDTWTSEVMLNYGGRITWKPYSDAEATSVVCNGKTSYIVGEELNTSSISVTIERSDGCIEKYNYASGKITLGEYDMSKRGKQSITVTCKDVTAQLNIYIHDLTSETMPANDYPESSHNYEDNLDKTYTYTADGAYSLDVTFSNETEAETNIDYIYVNGTTYTGKELANKTVHINGDTLTVRLVSDGSDGAYGFSIDSIIATYLVHEYTDTVVAPTCTEQGYTTHTCACGESHVDSYVDALGHSFGEWTVTTAPTCSEKGVETRCCSGCDVTETREVNALGHDLVHHDGKAAACTEKGWEAYDTCSRCDYTTYKEIPATGHSYTSVVTEPTRTEQGYTTHTCSRCDDSYVDTYVDALGHDLGEWTETKAATCTEKGAERRDCSRCEYYETREIEVLGHDYKDTVTDPTCTEQGYTTHTCSRCDDSYVDTYVDALGHDFGEWTETKTATCTEQGEERRDCSRCEYYETREIEALGHDYKAIVTDPTCTEQGYTAHTCSRCEDSYVDTYVDALGHDLGEWTETKAATCTEKGAEWRDCSRCEHYETREIEVLGHDYKDTVTDPTCTEQGYTTHTCSRCEDSYVDTYVDALGHDLGEWTGTKAATCTEKGAECRDCSRCEYYETREIEVLGHDYKDTVTDPTCTEQGYTTHTCSRCSDSYVDSYVDALGHDFGEWTETKAATCTEKGAERRDCSRCEHYETREIEVLGHDYKDTVTDPTCTEQGYTTHTCSRCDDSYVDTYVDALGHDLGEWTETKAATCTEKGAERRDCSRCEHYETREIEVLGHDYKDTVTDPTCTEQGYTTHTCSRCEDSYVDTYVDALGHVWDDGVVSKQPTATENGVKTFTCTRCGETRTEPVPATDDKPCDGGEDCPSAKFVDVNPKEWYHPYVDYAVEHGLFGGTSEHTFEPETAMTRAMLVTVLWRYEGKPMGYENTFVDVNAKSGSWYIDAVAWAAANNIVGGIGDGKFDPEGKITREQMATILFRYANWRGIDTSKRGDLNTFPDGSKTASWAKEAMQWTVAEKIIGGSDGKLLPQGSATRAQVATILMRFIENIVNK